MPEISMKEQLLAAKAAYVVTISGDNARVDRFSVYLQAEVADKYRGTGLLKALWPKTAHDCEQPGPKWKKFPDGEYQDWYEPLLPGMVYSRRRKYCAFHFALEYQSERDVADILQAVNPNLWVYSLHGGGPGIIKGPRE